jgi:predicted nucleic acid-binding protein
MSCFADTSALYAVLDADDANHARARETWAALLGSDETLHCTNYILAETFSLVQRRLGTEAVRAFQGNVAPLLEVTWIDSAAHRAGVNALLIADRRQLSLVDCTSFETIRRLGLSRVFAFDPHFAEQGCQVTP